MKIALIGEVRNAISKNPVAGTEAWTYTFAEELIARKYEVTLFANAESQISAGKIVKICKQSEIDANSGSELRYRNRFFIAKEGLEAIKRQSEFDLIHVSIFGFYYILPFMKLMKKPIFITIHGFTHSSDFARLIFKTYPEINYTFISNFYSKKLPPPKHYSIIHNGIQAKNFPFSDRGKPYYFWINRINKEKGVEHAVKFAKKTNSKLFIAGPIVDRDYFNSEVKPNISSKIRYLGPLDFKNKVNYYKNAKATLITINWDEPFGLTVIESMACGTPVIAFNRGAMSEIIEDGKNGFLVNPEDGIPGIIKAKSKLDNMSNEQYKKMRRSCREHVEKNFTVEKMVDEYEKVYQKVIADWKKKCPSP